MQEQEERGGSRQLQIKGAPKNLAEHEVGGEGREIIALTCVATFRSLDRRLVAFQVSPAGLPDTVCTDTHTHTPYTHIHTHTDTLLLLLLRTRTCIGAAFLSCLVQRRASIFRPGAVSGFYNSSSYLPAAVSYRCCCQLLLPAACCCCCCQLLLLLAVVVAAVAACFPGLSVIIDLVFPCHIAAQSKGFRLRKFRVFTVLEMLEIPSCLPSSSSRQWLQQ